MRLKGLLFILTIFFAVDSFAQLDRAFWFAAPDIDEVRDPVYGQYDRPILLRIATADQPAVVTISMPADAGFIPVVISMAANASNTVDLTSQIDKIENSVANTVQNKGLYIVATNDIFVYYEVLAQSCNCNPELFALKGQNALGNEFIIPSQVSWPVDTLRFPNARTSFEIVATENNTTVTITPSKPLIGRPANTPFTITLQRGQTFSNQGLYRQGSMMLNGSIVTANKPISVTVKEDLLLVNNYCADLSGDQLVPTSVFGKEFIVVKGELVNRDKVVVTAMENNTSVYLAGSATPARMINRGESYEFDLQADASIYIKTDKNVSVYHYTGVDCEVSSSVIPKLECTGATDVTIVRSVNEQAMVFIVTKNGNQGSFLVNGNNAMITAGDFAVVPGTAGAYVYCKKNLTGSMVTGAPTRFVNTSGKFHLGFINGAAPGFTTGTRYGYFSNYRPTRVLQSKAEICRYDSVMLQVEGGASYIWSPATGLSATDLANPKASPDVTTEYAIEITTPEGCIDSARLTVEVKPNPVFKIEAANSLCIGNSVELKASGGHLYTWEANTGITQLNISNPRVTPVVNTEYFVNISDTVCNKSERLSTMVTVHPLPLITATKSNDFDCFVGTSNLSATGGRRYTWSPANGLNNPAIASPVASSVNTLEYVVTGEDINGCKNTDTVRLNFTMNIGLYLMPNAFTPNNDNINDCYGIKDWGGIEELSFAIYNRWGERVFFTADPANCWNGTYKGVPQHSGVFIYHIKARTFCGVVERKGTFSLIR